MKLKSQIRKLKEKIEPEIVFLIITILVVITIAIINLELSIKILIKFLKLLKEFILIFVIVMILMFIFNFFEFKKLKQELKSKGIKAWIITITAGILSSGPIYVWYPLLADLKEEGMRSSLIATFLYNRAVKIPLLTAMIFYFGIKITLIVSILTIIGSIFNGILTEKLELFIG